MRKIAQSPWSFAITFWAVTAIILAPFAEAAHKCLIYEAYSPLEIPASEYYYIEVGEEDIGLVDGSVTGEEYKNRLSELMMSENVIDYEKFQLRIEQIGSMDVPGGIQPPLGPDGTPAPPPMKLPPGPQQQPNQWRPIPGSPTRPEKWIPTYPVPGSGGGQPGGSWDPENGHWDVHSGRGVTVRQLPDGTPVDHDNNPLCPPPPPPFEDYNYDVLLAGAAVVVGVALLVCVAPVAGVIAATIAVSAAAA